MYKCSAPSAALNTFLRVFTALLMTLAFTGCPEGPGKPLPTDLPPLKDTPNPDFVAGSKWLNESATSPFKEINIGVKNYVVLRIDNRDSASEQLIPGLATGMYTVRLSTPAAGQKLLSGYPYLVQAVTGIWFTDNPMNPATAQLAVLVPMGQMAPNYMVLMGTYLAGLDTMEWDVFIPTHDAGSNLVQLKPAPSALYKGSLVFRKQ